MSVEYNDNSIYITPPASAQEQELAYVRPGDIVNLEFSVENAKLEISNGDLVFSLADGGRVVLVSLVEMSFAENPPTITDSSGATYSVSDLVTSLEVVRQSEAVLIITQVEDTDKNAEEKPSQVISASEQDGSDISGSPSGGDGNIAYQTEGSPTDKVNPLGVVPGTVPFAGLGVYPATPNKDNAVGSSDSDSTLPGDINYEAQNSLNITYYYGDTVIDSGTTNIGGTNYNTIIIESGSSIRNEDPQMQILPSDINAQLGEFLGTSASYFVNARYKNDKIIRAVSVDYEGFKPVSITLSNIPSDVTIESTSSAVIRQNTDGTYSISQIPPGGDLTFNIIYDSGRSDEAFNMEYGVLYYDEYGEAVTFTYNQNIKFRSVSDASVFEGSDIIFSTDAGGIQVTTSAGNFSDIIVGGGAQNIVTTHGGNDYYFSGAGQDYVNLGDGDDIYYGNTGLDIVTGGAGIDTIRFDNADAGLANFDNTLYNTYTASQGISFYMGATKADVGSMASISTEVKSKFVDGDALIGTSDGQVIKGFEVFYGTHYSDTFYIGSVGLSTNIEIYAVDGAGTDTLSFDLWNTGISLDITSQSFTVGSGSYTFHDFDVYVGSENNDTFTSSVTIDLNGIIVDGGDGDDVMSYEARSEALIFDAFTNTVYDSSETYTNVIKNFEVLIGSSSDDIFKGSTNTHLFYKGGAGNDELTYLTAKSGISFDVMSNRIYKVANESFLYDELGTKAAFDEFDNSIESLVFTKSADIFYFSDSVVSATPVFTTIDGVEGLDAINLVDVADATITLNWDSAAGLDGLNYTHGGSSTFTFFNVERIRFGDGDDTFTINSMNTGQSYYVSGGDGVDTIDFGALTLDKSVAFDLSSGVATVTGGSTGNIQFSDLERFLGSQGDDIYYVSDSLLDGSVDAATYELNGNDGFDSISFRKLQVIEGGALIFDATTGTGNPTIEYGGEVIEFNLVSIEGIEGTAYDDIFKINYNSDLDTQSTSISGSDGNDTLELVVAAGDSVVLNLYEGKVGGDRISGIEIFTNLSDLDDTVIMTSGNYQIDAGTGNDTVDFSHLTTYVVFDFKEDGRFLATVGGSLSESVLSNFETIVGTRSDDTFKLAAENTSGADITYSIDGGLGNNRISFESSSVAITGFSLNDTGNHTFSGTNSTTYNWQNITSFTFTDLNDEIISNQEDKSFTVVGGDGIDKIIYSSLTTGITYQMAQGWVIKGSGVDRISSIEHIVATDYNDTFILTASDGITIDAGSGTDVVNLSAIQGDKVIISFDGSKHGITVEDSSSSISMELIGVESIFSSSADETYYVFEDTKVSDTYSGVYTFQSNNLDAESYVDFSNISGAITYNLADFSITGNTLFASDFRMVLNTITGIILTDGNDTIIGSANISIVIDGGAGTDTIDYSGLSTAINFDLGTGKFLKINNNLSDTVSNVEVIIATGSNDVFSFGTDSSAIGSLGITSIDGGAGTDSISFADIKGDFLIYTSTSNYTEVIVGSSSLDSFGRIDNVESIIGTAQNDVFVIQGINTSDVFSPSNISFFDGSSGIDIVNLTSYTTNNTITFNSSSVGTINLSGITISFQNMEIFKLGSGDDTIVAGLSGSIHFDLGAGDNVLDYSSLPVGIVVDFDAKQITKAGTNVDSFEDLGQIAEFKGTDYSDTFRVSDISLIASVNIDGGGVDSSGYSTDTDILEITSNSGTTVDLTSGSIGVISNIERIKTGSGNDTFILGGAHLFQTNAGYFVTVDGGDGTDTADYSSSSNAITFDMTRGIVTRTFGGNSITDTLISIEAIVGSTANDVFNAYTGTMSIDGGAGTDVLNFGGLGFNSIDIDITSKQVSFKNLEGNDAAGLVSFDNIENIVGTRYNDRIDVSNVPSGGFTETIVIDGGAGDDSVSFYNKTSAHTLDLSSGTGVNLGNVTLVSFESIQLTTFGDTVIMSDTDESSIDGGEGTDFIDYSSSTDSVSVSFIAGYLTKSVGSDVYSNSFENFEQVTTGSGNDRFVLSSDLLNNSSSGSIILDAGAGNDIIDLTNVSDISFKDTAKSTLSSSGELTFNYVKDGGSDATATFKNFETYSFDVVGTFNLEIQQANRTGDISFVSASSSDKVNVTFGGSTSYDVVFNASSSLVTSGSGGNYRILGASSISATGNVGLTYVSSVVNNYDVGFVGTSATSTADYSGVQFASSFKVTSINSSGMTFGVVKGDTDAIDSSTTVDETLTNATKIIGTANADRFDLYENTTGMVFDIDLGGGNAINTLLINSSTAVNVMIDATGSFAITGYNVTNGYYIAGLTDLGDTITLTANPVSALEFAGGGGTDKIDYSALTGVDLQVVISSDGINVLRGAGGNVLEDKLGEFESIIGSSTNSQNVFIVSSISSGSAVSYIDGGVSDTNSSYYDSLILTGYSNATTEALTLDVQAGSISIGSSSLTQIIDFKNIENITLGAQDDIIKLYYDSASSVGSIKTIAGLGGTDTVQIKEGSAVDLSSGLFTIADGSGSTTNTYVTNVEVIDVVSAASGALTTIYVSTAISDTGYYKFKSTGTGLTGKVDINYYNYSTAITVQDIASGAIEISTSVGMGKDAIDADLAERAIITGTTYDDTFNISNFQNASGDVISRTFVGGDGNDLINLDFTSASAITSVDITIGSSTSIVTNTSSSAISQTISEFEQMVVDAGGKDVSVVFDPLDIAPSDVAVVNSNNFEVDLSKLDTSHDTAISLSADGSDLRYGFNVYSGIIGSNLDYTFYNVNTILYGGKDSGFNYNWVVDDSYLNLVQTSASGGASLNHVSGTTFSTLSFVNLRNIAITVGDNFDATILSYTDSSNVDHDISANDVAFTQGIYELTLTSGDDVLKGRTIAIDATAVYDLGFGVNTVEVNFGTFGDATNTISVNYILTGGAIYAAHKDNTGGDFTTYLGASYLTSDVGRDTLTLRNNDKVNLTYNSGDTTTMEDNKTSSANIGKDEFIYTHTTATGGQSLGSSVFSLQFETTHTTPYFNSVKDWGIDNNSGVLLNHLGSTINFTDVYGVNSYVLDSSTGAYTIDNTLRFNTSINSMHYLKYGNSWNNYRVDTSSWRSKMAEYGTASDNSYKDNPYIMYAEFEIGGGTNVIDFDTGVWIGSDYTWNNDTEIHLVTGSDGRLLINITVTSDDRLSGNKFESTGSGANAYLIDSDADMAQTAYNTGNLFTIHADTIQTITGPGGGRFDFRADFDTYTAANPIVSSGDIRTGLSSDGAAYSWDTAALYDIGDKYLHFSYNGTSDGLSFSYGDGGDSILNVDYSTSYFFDGILTIQLDNSADTMVRVSINSQMPSTGGAQRYTAVALNTFSQESIVDFSGYSYNAASTGNGIIYVRGGHTSKFGTDQIAISATNNPTSGSGEWAGGLNFGSVLLPTAYTNFTIDFANDGKVNKGIHFYSPEMSPATNITIAYSSSANYDINVTNIGGSSGTSYTQVERTYNGTAYATDIYYFDTSSGSVTGRSGNHVVDNSFFDVSVSGVYTVGYAGVSVINNEVDYIFEDQSNNILKIQSISVGSTYDLGNGGNNLVINSGIDTLYIGENSGYFQESGNSAVSFGNGSESFFIGGADYIQAGMDTNYMLSSYADINIISTGYNETITVLDLGANYQVFGDYTIESLDYSNLDNGFSFSLNDSNSSGNYVSDNYDGSHSAKIGQVQDIKGSLGDDNFSVDGDISSFSIDGSDGLDIVSIANIDNNTTAQDLAESMDNIEILELSNIEQDVFEITVEDIINMTDENNNLVIKNSDNDTILQIISSNSDYILSTSQDANGNDVYSIYSSSDPSSQIGEVTVIKDNSNNNNI